MTFQIRDESLGDYEIKMQYDYVIMQNLKSCTYLIILIINVIRYDSVTVIDNWA